MTNWTSTPIIGSDKCNVTLSWKQCARQNVNGIRYVWRTSPCPYKKCAIYSVENELPAPPFVILAHFTPGWNTEKLNRKFMSNWR